MSKLASVVFLSSALWVVSASAEEAIKLREEIAVPVDYQGRQIQLTGWFERPVGAGPFPVVIALHSCSGYTANMYGGALPLWVPFLQGQGYATFKLDSFTARGHSNVCATPNAVTAADRAADVLAAAAVLAGGRTSGPTASPSLAGRMAAALRCTLRATTSNCGRCGRSWRLAAAGSRPASGSIRAAAAGRKVRRAVRSSCRCWH
jgi:dienelactone hydrolase